MSEAFLNEVKNIETDILSFSKSASAVSQLQKRALNAINAQEEKRITAKISEFSQENTNLANQIRNRMHALKNRVKEGAPDYQLRKNHVDNLARKFMEALQRFQGVQANHQHMQQDKIRRQYLIANPNASEEELRNAMESEETGPIFSQSLVSGQRSSEARKILNEVEQRHEEVVKLAQSIEQLSALFLDMQTIVEGQDAMIIRIGDSIQDTEINTENAAKEMTEAVVHQRNANRRCRLLALCLCILLIVILIIIFTVPLFGEPLIVKIIQGSQNSGTSSKQQNSVNK